MAAHTAFTLYGHGPARVVVLQDWLCDQSSWDPMWPYLSPQRSLLAALAERFLEE